MANRSYLYTTDYLPDSPEWQEKPNFRGIGEWNYDIPLTFQLLLSANPIPVKTTIWDIANANPIAIAGDAKEGLAHLEAYMARLPEQAQPLILETKEFFSQPKNVKKYFILESAEIFMMFCETNDEIEAQNLSLLAEIKSLGVNLLNIPLPEEKLNQDKKEGIFTRLFSSKNEPKPLIDPLKPYYPLGFGNWSNILYFDFSDAD